MDLTGKNVLISGGTRGIGSSIVDTFNEAGANIFATGTNNSEIQKLNNAANADSKIKYLQLDVTDQNSIELFSDAIKLIPQIDVLINNAGVNKINPVTEIEDGDWDWIQTVNLKGVFQLTKQVAKKMKKQKHGKIVNVSSIWGVISKAQRAAYSTSKWGLIGFTKSVALDLAPYNVLVNAISPGFVNTELTKKILSREQMDELSRNVPLGRFAEPKEIAKTILYLSSDLNTYITGQNIVVDGGFVSQ